MKLPLTIINGQGTSKRVVDAEGTWLFSQWRSGADFEIDSKTACELVAYANAYHQIRDIVDRKRLCGESDYDRLSEIAVLISELDTGVRK